MPNGKPGDHPFTDIVIHGRDVYSERAASLVRQIAALVGEQERQQLADMLFHDYNEYSTPDVPRLEQVLTAMLAKAQKAARDRGYEI